MRVERASSHPGLMFPKRREVRLEVRAYRGFIERLFAHYDWRCAACHKVTHLTCHHTIKRSRLCRDTFDNCIPLCLGMFGCHDAAERGAFLFTYNPMTERFTVARKV